ncbi:amidoligase family protein (plasmid) [Burkholderia sp. M6-3]
MVALAAGGLGARAATNGGLIGLSANRHTGLPQCPVSSCAEVPAFWAGGVKSESAASHVTNDELPFCESTFVGVYEAAQRLFDEGMPALPYLLDDATNGLARPDGGRRFGFEVEFDFDSSVDRKQGLQMLARIAQDLYDANLTKARSISEHHALRKTGYSSDPDSGALEQEVDPPPRRAIMGEWVSPISSDEPAQWNRTKAVLDIVKRQPVEINERTGTHIHVGLPDYGDNVEAFTNLLALAQKYEDVLYRLGGRAQLKPSVVPTQRALLTSAYMQELMSAVDRGPQLRGIAYRRPNRTPRDRFNDVEAFLNDQAGNRRVALNFQPVGRGASRNRASDRVEVRIPDATLNPEILQAHITTYIHLVDKALQAAQGKTTLKPAAREPLGTHYKASGDVSPKDWDRFLADTATFRGMLDELFDRNIDKARLTALFAITGWQPPPQAPNAMRQRLGEMGFRTVHALERADALREAYQYHFAALLALVGGVWLSRSQTLGKGAGGKRD